MAIDTQLFYLLNNLAGQSPFFDRVIVFLAEDFAYLLVLLFLILAFFSRYSKRKKWEMFLVASVASAVASFVTTGIRFFYHHPRPFMVLKAHQLVVDMSWSFPSRHATFFFAMATALYLYNKKWGVWFFIAATLVAVSRVVAGVHYPSDIISGAILGALVAYATFYFAQRIGARKTH